MIKLSKLTDYAIVILATMAEGDGGLLSAASIAAQTNLPEPTVSKILKLLTKADVVDSVRGVNGGYRLSNTADHLPVTNIVEAIEGPIALTACVEGSEDSCMLAEICSLSGRWAPVNLAIRDTLTDITLADMVRTA